METKNRENFPHTECFGKVLSGVPRPSATTESKNKDCTSKAEQIRNGALCPGTENRPRFHGGTAYTEAGGLETSSCSYSSPWISQSGLEMVNKRIFWHFYKKNIGCHMREKKTQTKSAKL